MGWGAAQSFYEENSSWLDSVEEAYELLYPVRKQRKGNQCPKCGKRLKNSYGVNAHLRDKHHVMVTAHEKRKQNLGG